METQSTTVVTEAAPVESLEGEQNPSEEIEASESDNEETSAKQKTEEKVANLKKFKLKVDGEEVEEELDLNDEESLRQRLQLAKAAKKRMAEAVNAKRQAVEIIKAFEADPETMLKRLGTKGREIAEKYLLSQIKEEMMTPEQKQRMAEETELQQLRREKEERIANAEKEKVASLEKKYVDDFQNTIISAIQKTGLPKTPELVKRMAAIMAKNLDYGLELSPEDLALEVKNEVILNLKSIVGDSDGEALIGMLGDDVAKKIRKYDVKKIKEQQEKFITKPNEKRQSSGKSHKNDRPMTMDEWRAQINSRIKD